MRTSDRVNAFPVKRTNRRLVTIHDVLRYISVIDNDFYDDRRRGDDFYDDDDWMTTTYDDNDDDEVRQCNVKYDNVRWRRLTTTMMQMAWLQLQRNESNVRWDDSVLVDEYISSIHDLWCR